MEWKMKTNDLYGFSTDDLEATRLAIEQALGIRLVAHESLYLGGDYYRLGHGDEEQFVLRRNIDLLDAEPAELKFPQARILFYVNETERSEEIEMLLTKLPDITLLRRKFI
jgi:hypothetical protein